jgi:hypothetical protein
VGAVSVFGSGCAEEDAVAVSKRHEAAVRMRAATRVSRFFDVLRMT